MGWDVYVSIDWRSLVCFTSPALLAIGLSLIALSVLERFDDTLVDWSMVARTVVCIFTQSLLLLSIQELIINHNTVATSSGST